MCKPLRMQWWGPVKNRRPPLSLRSHSKREHLSSNFPKLFTCKESNQGSMQWSLHSHPEDVLQHSSSTLQIGGEPKSCVYNLYLWSHTSTVVHKYRNTSFTASPIWELEMAGKMFPTSKMLFAHWGLCFWIHSLCFGECQRLCNHTSHLYIRPLHQVLTTKYMHWSLTRGVGGRLNWPLGTQI